MRVLQRAVCVAALLAGCAGEPERPPPRPAQPVFDNAIVPRVRIGPATIGMTEADLLRWFGSPTETMRYKKWDGAIYYYNAHGFNVRVSGGIVDSITTQDRRYAMANGIRVGSSELELNVHLGRPASRQDHGAWWDYCYADRTYVMVQMPQAVVTGITINGCNP